MVLWSLVISVATVIIAIIIDNFLFTSIITIIIFLNILVVSLLFDTGIQPFPQQSRWDRVAFEYLSVLIRFCIVVSTTCG